MCLKIEMKRSGKRPMLSAGLVGLEIPDCVSALSNILRLYFRKTKMSSGKYYAATEKFYLFNVVEETCKGEYLSAVGGAPHSPWRPPIFSSKPPGLVFW